MNKKEFKAKANQTIDGVSAKIHELKAKKNLPVGTQNLSMTKQSGIWSQNDRTWKVNMPTLKMHPKKSGMKQKMRFHPLQTLLRKDLTS